MDLFLINSPELYPNALPSMSIPKTKPNLFKKNNSAIKPTTLNYHTITTPLLAITTIIKTTRTLKHTSITTFSSSEPKPTTENLRSLYRPQPPSTKYLPSLVAFSSLHLHTRSNHHNHQNKLTIFIFTPSTAAKLISNSPYTNHDNLSPFIQSIIIIQNSQNLS
jgi:hypothetical protein